MTDVSDAFLCSINDGDTSYLASISSEDFNDSTDFGSSNIRNSKLVDEMNKVDTYSPIVEDISIDNITLLSTAKQIEYK